MTTSTRKSQGLNRSLKNLSISPSAKSSTLDSWEDHSSSSSSSSSPTTPTSKGDSSPPGPPPPTPSSPTHFRKRETSTPIANIPRSPPATFSSFPPSSPASSSPRSDKRPEKSNATAGRLIAGALGVKAKKTEEGVRYERAVREKEVRRREREREEVRRVEREKEEKRREVWEG